MVSSIRFSSWPLSAPSVNKKKHFWYLWSNFSFRNMCVFLRFNPIITYFGFPLLIVNLYNPPKNSPYRVNPLDIKLFLDSILRRFEGTKTLMGDFNQPDFEAESYHTGDVSFCSLTDFLLEHNFHQIVDRPTHNSNHMLDLIWSNFSEVLPGDHNLIEVPFSDHSCVTIIIPWKFRNKTDLPLQLSLVIWYAELVHVYPSLCSLFFCLKMTPFSIIGFFLLIVIWIYSVELNVRSELTHHTFIPLIQCISWIFATLHIENSLSLNLIILIHWIKIAKSPLN